MEDIEQFEAFMRRYQDMVYSTCMRLLANETEAQDIAQDVFVKAFERFDALRDSPTAGGWLKTVATNLCINHLTRYRKRWLLFSDMPASDDQDAADCRTEFVAPDDVGETTARADQYALVEQALQKLPDAQRVPLVLFHLEGMSYEEIAARLNVSVGKVKTDIFRARQTLRRKLRLKLGDARTSQNFA
ncbi:MAG: sigma-70 family RNA polymerase sigma factor [Verrucomicrobiales bacterium]|nr:sigma-70 family RNA polymerase sigma factor [Verrucomicrobiales bacterium]